MKSMSNNARALYDATAPIGPTTGSTQFGDFFKTHKMTAPQMAEKLGCTESSVRNWRRASHVPSIEAARRIELITGIPIAAWVQPLEEKGVQTVGPLAEIESITLDVEGPAIEAPPVKGPADLDAILDEILETV